MRKIIFPALAIGIFLVSSCNNTQEKVSSKDSLNKNTAANPDSSDYKGSARRPFGYPAVPNNGKSMSDFIPAGWMVLKAAQPSDLNNDKNNDLAFVLQHRDSVPLVKPEGNHTDTVIAQPRILIVAFFNTVTKQYDLAEQNNTFISYHADSNRIDPLDYVSIADGNLLIGFMDYGITGDIGRLISSYKFRYTNNEFQLIEAEQDYATCKACPTESHSTYDFLVKKVKISTGNLSKPTVTVKTLDLKELKTLKTFTEPGSWEVEKGVFL